MKLNKKGDTLPSITTGLVLALLIIGVFGWKFQTQASAATKTIDFSLKDIKSLNCKQKEVIVDFDFDGLDDSCDPCLSSRADSGKDSDGDGMDDVCEDGIEGDIADTKNNPQKIACKYWVYYCEKIGEIFKVELKDYPSKQCCSMANIEGLPGQVAMGNTRCARNEEINKNDLASSLCQGYD